MISNTLEYTTEVQIELLPTQHDFVTSDKMITCFLGGVGSGKSYGLAWWVILTAQQYPNTIGMLVANTYKQLKDATLATIFALCDEYNIPYTYKVTGELRIFKSLILCRSVDNYNNLRGPNIGWLACDEAAFYDKQAWDVLIGRLRDKKGPLQIKIATTPAGYNWLYDLMVTNNKGNRALINSSSNNNIHLPQSYLDSLKEQYDDKVYQQEVEGKFINLKSGQIYYGFNRDVHVVPVPEKVSGNYYVGADFNVDPITAVKVVCYGNVIHVVDELFINNSNTFELSQAIKQQWGVSTIKPDASSNARKTSATKTDAQILRDDGHVVLPTTSNPAVKDRYNTVNGALYHKRLLVSPNCKKLIADLEKFTYDNKDPMLSHISDALGYIIWHLMPLKKPDAPLKTYYF
jgi:PBSX family phage terminase large subunit